MATPTPSWNQVRVFGTWKNMDGSFRAGSWKITIPARVTSATDDSIIPAGVFAQGDLQTGDPAEPSLEILVPATDDPDITETGWKIQIDVKPLDATAERYVIDVPIARAPAPVGDDAGVNLRTIAVGPPAADLAANYRIGVAGGLALLNTDGDVVDADGAPVGGGAATWAELTGKPTSFPTAAADIPNGTTVGRSVLTAADGPAVRTVIGAGTSNLALGTTGSTAKAGNYAPTWAEVTSKPAVIAAGADQASARSSIGAGTSSLALGTTSSTAKAGDYVPAWTEVTGKPAVIASGADQAAARASIGAGTSNLAIGTSSTTAKAGDWTPGIAHLPAGSVLYTATTTRPTARTDVAVIFTGATDPGSNALDGDMWMQP